MEISDQVLGELLKNRYAVSRLCVSASECNDCGLSFREKK